MQNNLVNAFFTIAGKEEFRFKEKGSLFIGIAFQVQTPADCEQILAQHRKEFYDATHVCYAYRIANGPVKYSDDGEPSGTAGVRIFNAIEHFNFFNVLVLSIRYFGGTKLGVGPLGKAYYDSAFETLSLCQKSEKKLMLPAKLAFDYSQISQVYRVFSLLPVRIIASEFTPSPVFSIQIPLTEAKALESELTTLLNGKFTLTFDNKNMVYAS